MNLKQLFTINFFIALFFGISCGIFPSWILQFYGLEPNNAAIWTTRLVGGSILGFASLMWFGRKAASVDVRRAIAFALLIQDLFGFIASVEIQVSGSVNVFGWSSPILYGLLTLSYAYFLYIRRTSS
jgi:hypothetical protein